VARYYLHLRDGTDEILDLDGIDFSDLEALHTGTLTCARDIISADIRSQGVMDQRYRIDAEDSSGRIVHTLSFREAVMIIYG
jgi:hypothetical protein